MYRGKDRQTPPLFSELFPFGGKLDSENRWLKIAKLIPWEEIECKYKRFFSGRGRPSLDSRLVIGILLLKHMTGFSDDDIVKLGSGEVGTCERFFSEGMHDNVGCAVKHEPDTVRHEAMTGCPTAPERDFMIFDEVFHLAAPAVDGFV